MTAHGDIVGSNRMATSHPHVPAAFINAIAEEGTKAEAIEYLQKTWNELCALKSRVAQRPELTHSPALEHGADGYFRAASLRTIIARAALAVIEKPDGVETLDWQIADAVIAMLPKSLAPQPALEPTIGKYRADYLPVTAEEIAKEDPELTELYAHSRPALDPATVEAMACIIDLDAFVQPKHPAPDDAMWRGQRKNSALTKAEAIRALLAAASCASKAVSSTDNKWRTIDTAPKDGSRCDVWAVYDNGLEARGQRYPNAQYKEHEKSWFDAYGNRLDWEKVDEDDGIKRGRKTTHWIPLPADPVTQQERGQS